MSYLQTVSLSTKLVVKLMHKPSCVCPRLLYSISDSRKKLKCLPFLCLIIKHVHVAVIYNLWEYYKCRWYRFRRRLKWRELKVNTGTYKVLCLINWNIVLPCDEVLTNYSFRWTIFLARITKYHVKRKNIYISNLHT